MTSISSSVSRPAQSLCVKRTATARRQSSAVTRAAAQEPLLVRTARGEDVERTPVWLMRQAGRYMAEFREFSDKYAFRHRSETPEIAIELSLQPWRAFGTDAVIFFSDILTPLPAMGIEFDVIKGKGPAIMNPVRSMDDVRALKPMADPAASLPFIHDTLSSIRSTIDPETALVGFIGTPWTLAAYSMEGKAEKNCRVTKTIMMNNPEVLLAFLDHLTEALIVYLSYQIESGAQVVQLFDSWAHHLSPAQFQEFSLPYANRLIAGVRARHPDVPIIFHANGGTGKLEFMAGGAVTSDVIGLDWHCDMGTARSTFGADTVLQGNVDPMVLFAKEDKIREEVGRVLGQAGSKHILGVGHGVIQGTPEESVGIFVDACKQLSKRKEAVNA
uniref:Uroporphyrinogen decarboxylase n=1 Tax=Tetraselmis chuii TaxID=63592 RepID=A0A7S1X255_9CHLO|mmetsp:Transcript_22811/g.40601  ORF Transcript_22811/g.40601 Transcript_22811/m.40601 type:complete len:387 (+) Transcript_22811:113-1273(+)